MKYDNQSALDVYLILMKETPAWVSKLMMLRNGIVSRLGLKNLGEMSDVDCLKSIDNYDVGEQLGIFSIHSKSQNEVILEDRDKHLDVMVSLYLDVHGETVTVSATTVVHVKNFFGKIYMFFVAPMHKLIVPASLRGLSRV
jgi:hypothetical protein